MKILRGISNTKFWGNLIAYINNLSWNQSKSENYYRDEFRRYLNFIFLYTMVAAPIFYILLPRFREGLLWFLLPNVLGTVLHLILAKRFLIVARIVQLVGTFLGLASIVFLTGGMASVGFPYFIIIILIAGIHINSRAASITTIVILIYTLLLLYLDAYGMLPPVIYAQDISALFFGYAPLFLMMAAFMFRSEIVLRAFSKEVSQKAFSDYHKMRLEQENNLLQQSILEEKASKDKLVQDLSAIQQVNEDLEQQKDLLSQNLESNHESKLHQEKLAYLGENLAGIAHEINSPLAALQSSLTSLQTLTDDITRGLYQLQVLPLEYADELRFLLNTILKPKVRLDTRGFRKLKRELRRSLQEDMGIDETSQQLATALAEMGVTKEELLQVRGLLTSKYVDVVFNLLLKLANQHSSLEVMRLASDRALAIATALRKFSRQGQEERQLADINDGIQTTLQLLAAQIKQGVSIRLELGNIPHIPCYWDELNQVWTNLLNNAMQAMDFKGTIRIQSRVYKDYIQVLISDDGPGIPREVLDRVWQPYFTTKPAGMGTGLGLPLVKKIIEDKHGGDIFLQSEPGETVFTILLPINEPLQVV